MNCELQAYLKHYSQKLHLFNRMLYSRSDFDDPQGLHLLQLRAKAITGQEGCFRFPGLRCGWFLCLDKSIYLSKQGWFTEMIAASACIGTGGLAVENGDLNWPRSSYTTHCDIFSFSKHDSCFRNSGGSIGMCVVTTCQETSLCPFYA